MPTVRQRRILEDLGITCWIDRAAARTLEATSAVAAGASPMPQELKALLEEPPATPVARRSRSAAALSAPSAAAPASSATITTARSPLAAAELPRPLGCLWVPGTLLLCEAQLTPEDGRFCRDLLQAAAALETIDRASTSQRARLRPGAKPQWLAIAATDLASDRSDFQSAALGLLRKRIDTAGAQRLLLCGGPQGTAASWLAASGQDAALNDQLDPALAALGARFGRWQRDDQSVPVYVLPAPALLRSEPQRKARLWRWLLEQDTDRS